MLAMCDIVSCCLPFSIMPVTGFVFSMFSGSTGKKAGFRPFVFNNFSGLGRCAQGGHHVSVWVARCWPFD
jgi:hypothetical protein